MAIVETALTLGEVFLETADGTRISLGQLKAPLSISVSPVSETPKEPEPIKIGSTVRISDDPKCVDYHGHRNGYVLKSFAGQTGTVTNGQDDEDGNWTVEHDGSTQLIAPEHLTVVA